MEKLIEDFKDKTSYFKITVITPRERPEVCNLPQTAPVVEDDDNKKLKRKQYYYYLPKKNKHHGRFTLGNQSQIEGESVVTYTACFREKKKGLLVRQPTDDGIQ